MSAAQTSITLNSSIELITKRENTYKIGIHLKLVKFFKMWYMRSASKQCDIDFDYQYKYHIYSIFLILIYLYYIIYVFTLWFYLFFIVTKFLNPWTSQISKRNNAAHNFVYFCSKCSVKNSNANILFDE
jgi:hypothetical protein